MAAAVGGATTFGIRIADAAEGGADEGPAGAEMTMVPGAGAEETALATTAEDVDRFTGLIWEGVATTEVGARGGATPAGTGAWGAAAEAVMTFGGPAVLGGVLMVNYRSDSWSSFTVFYP